MSQLGDVDMVAAAAFWQRAIDAGVVPIGTPPTVGLTFTDDMMTVFECFEVLYAD